MCKWPGQIKSNSKPYLLFFHLNVFMAFSQFPGEAPMDMSASLCRSGLWIKSRRSPKPQFTRTPLRSEAALRGCFSASNSNTLSPQAGLCTPTGFILSWRLLNNVVGSWTIPSLLLQSFVVPDSTREAKLLGMRNSIPLGAAEGCLLPLTPESEVLKGKETWS